MSYRPFSVGRERQEPERRMRTLLKIIVKFIPFEEILRGWTQNSLNRHESNGKRRKLTGKESGIVEKLFFYFPFLFFFFFFSCNIGSVGLKTQSVEWITKVWIEYSRFWHNFCRAHPAKARPTHTYGLIWLISKCSSQRFVEIEREYIRQRLRARYTCDTHGWMSGGAGWWVGHDGRSRA